MLIKNTIKLVEKLFIPIPAKSFRRISSINSNQIMENNIEIKNNETENNNLSKTEVLDNNDIQPNKKLKTDNESNVASNQNKQIKWKYKKFVVLLSYCGLGYYGMQ